MQHGLTKLHSLQLSQQDTVPIYSHADENRYIPKGKLFLHVSSCKVLACFFNPMTSPHTSWAPQHRCAFMCSDITFTKTLKA